MKLMATPANNSVSMVLLFPVFAMSKIAKSVNNEIVSALNVVPKMNAFKPNMMANPAPNEAPEEIPSMYGSQIGLRKML